MAIKQRKTSREITEQALEDLIRSTKPHIRGQVADYIPELRLAHPETFAIAIRAVEGVPVEAGQSLQLFTIQEISWMIGLLYALDRVGPTAVFSRVGIEPTGSRNAIPVRSRPGLELPGNPLSDMGALAVASLFPGADGDTMLTGYLEFLSQLCGNQSLRVDESVFDMELRAGHTSRSNAWYLQSEGIISAPKEGGVIDFIEGLMRIHFRQASTLVNCRDLARLGAVLANSGRDPETGNLIADSSSVRTVLAVMSLAGLHEESGPFLARAGIPSVSGVSGGMVGVIPGKLGIAAYNPRVDIYGVSTFGQEVFTKLSQTTALSQSRTREEHVPSTVSRYSCFISYSHEDEAFASYIYKRLRAEDVRVWYAPEHIRSGRRLKPQIDVAIKTYDRLLVVLSAASMRSSWVGSEILEARIREQNEGKRILFPIRLADFDTIREWSSFDSDSGVDVARELREYFIPDFSDWRNRKSFDRTFGKLLRSLERNA